MSSSITAVGTASISSDPVVLVPASRPWPLGLFFNLTLTVLPGGRPSWLQQRSCPREVM